jgi:hypothetical protein
MLRVVESKASLSRQPNRSGQSYHNDHPNQLSTSSLPATPHFVQKAFIIGSAMRKALSIRVHSRFH